MVLTKKIFSVEEYCLWMFILVSYIKLKSNYQELRNIIKVVLNVTGRTFVAFSITKHSNCVSALQSRLIVGNAVMI